VDSAGEEFLAGARFPEEQDCQRRSGALLHISEQAQERRILCDDPELTTFTSQLVELCVADGAGSGTGGAQILELPIQLFELPADGLFLRLNFGQFGPQGCGCAGEILLLTG
jgi:hypothetical protein